MAEYRAIPTKTNLELGVSAGNDQVEGISVVHKFGENLSVGTSYEPVCQGGIYRTPQAAGATALRVKAGNVADIDTTGSGARKVTLQGLDENFELVEETISTNGDSAGSASTTTFTRLFRAYVSESGTYADQDNGSHVADVVIENSAGTEDWAIIESQDFPRSQSEIGSYTVPRGYRAYVKEFFLTAEGAKSTDFIFFQRQGANKTSAPYDAMRVVFESRAQAGEVFFSPSVPLGPFPEYTDIGFMAEVSTGTGAVEVDFEIILEKYEA